MVCKLRSLLVAYWACVADIFGSFWGLAEGALEGGSQD